jgi:hypothetical protein
MMRLVPFYLAYAYGVEVFFDLGRMLLKSSATRKLVEVSVYAVIVVVFLAVAKPGGSVFRALGFNHSMPRIAEIAQILTPDRVVLSDILTSTDLVEFADVYSLVLQFNGPVDLVDISAGREVVDQVLRERLSFEEILKVLAREGVSYIVIDKTVVPGQGVFAAHPTAFRVLYEDVQYTVYGVSLGGVL